MPLYDYRCGHCLARATIQKRLAQLDRLEGCPKCGQAMARQISAPRIAADYAGYSCPVTGKWIEGRRAHEENLRQQGCRVLESGEKADFLRRRADDERQFDAAVEQTAGEVFTAMPPEKQRAVEIAVEHGLDVSITRSGV